MDQSKTVRFDSPKVDIQAEDYKTLCLYTAAPDLLKACKYLLGTAKRTENGRTLEDWQNSDGNCRHCSTNDCEHNFASKVIAKSGGK